MFLVKYLGEIIKWLFKLIFKKSIDHIDSQYLILTIILTLSFLSWLYWYITQHIKHGFVLW